MNTQILASVYNRLPGPVRSAVKKTDTYDRLLETRRDEYYSERFTWVTVTVRDAEFEVLVPEWGGEKFWPEHDPYNPHLCHEPPVSRKFVDSVESGDVVWDMGSRYGYYASIAAQVTDSPQDVHVLEMSERKCWRIQQINEKQFDAAMHVINGEVGNRSSPGIVTGDGYAEETSYPDVVKIDIEGAEGAALDGMRTVLQEASPTLLIEMHPNKMYRNFGSTDDSLLQLLDEYGYDIQVCERFRNFTGEWDGEWQDHTRNVNKLAADANLSDEESPLGYIDPASYAVFAEP